MDSRRLADIRAGTSREMLASGSGYLVAPHLVLTARHVVLDEWGAAQPRIVVLLGYPEGSRARRSAVVQWDDRNLDLALLRLDIGMLVSEAPVRWGCFVGTEPVRYEGLAFPRFADYESGPGVEQLGGYLPPLALGEGFRYVLDQSSAPEVMGTSEWGGASGTAIFCNGLLVAVVSKDDRTFGNRRLHATRLAGVLLNPDFARIVAEDVGSWPIAEAVELSEVLRPPARHWAARTPGSLLAADLEVVGFAGRTQVISDLTTWRGSGSQLRVALMVGEGGQGKTRLAREFARLSSAAGWIAGFTATVSAHGDRRHRDNAEKVSRLLRASSKPVLAITDYAETHPDFVEQVVNDLRVSPPRSPIRLLLLARGVNAWWESLVDLSPREDATLIVLPPLANSVVDRQRIYAEAVMGLAQRMPGLAPERTVVDGGPTDWAKLARGLVDDPPDLSDDRLRNALTLHMAALTDLLDADTGKDRSREENFDEQELARHEFSYLRRTAAKQGLFDRDVLSSRTDQYARDQEAWSLLKRSLAGLILLGPTGAERAFAIGGLASADRAADVTAWLAALYPPSAEYGGVGSIQPDRLAEMLLGSILVVHEDLLEKVAEQLTSYDEAIALLFIVLRTAAHPASVHVRNQVRTLILKRRAPFAEAALTLAVNLAHVASMQGSESAVAALQAILQRAVSINDSVNPAALTSAIQLASERLAALRISADGSKNSSGTSATPRVGKVAEGDPHDGLYRELAKGKPLFVSALLDVALDAIGISFDETQDDRQLSRSSPAQPSTISAAETLSVLYVEHYQQLVRLAVLLVKDVETAEEVVQASLESLMSGALNRLQDQGKILAYLRQTIVNRARSALRSRSIEYFEDFWSIDRIQDLRPVEIAEDQYEFVHLPSVPSAEYEAIGIIERTTVIDALRALPGHQREVIVLHYYADLPAPEIAKTLKMSQDSVQSHMSGAMNALREYLKYS